MFVFSLRTYGLEVLFREKELHKTQGTGTTHWQRRFAKQHSLQSTEKT